MTIIVSFLLANWRWFAGAAAALGVTLAVWLHVHHDAAVVRQRDQARADNVLWAQAYSDEKRAVDLQNAAMDRMGADSRAWQQRAQAATAAAHRASVKAQASAAAFLAIKPKGATVCARTEDIAARIRSEQ